MLGAQKNNPPTFGGLNPILGGSWRRQLNYAALRHILPIVVCDMRYHRGESAVLSGSELSTFHVDMPVDKPPENFTKPLPTGFSAPAEISGNNLKLLFRGHLPARSSSRTRCAID